MLYFPQLLTGAMSQFPIRKTRSHRTIITISEDGHRFAIPDEGRTKTGWVLSFNQLSDDEINQLILFFNATEGCLQSFTFLDPTANLLSWSENLEHAIWQKNSFLQLQGSIGDFFGSTRSYRITNTGSGELPLEQTINVPGSMTCCFSVYARSDSGASVSLGRISGGDSQTSAFSLGPAWTRLTLSEKLDNGDGSSVFRLSLGPTNPVDLFGFQVDPQPGASTYAASFADSGVYPAARFDSDAISITASGPGRNACSLKIVAPANG